MTERAKAVFYTEFKVGTIEESFDKCEGYNEECITSDAFPSYCPINDHMLATCKHLERGDDVDT